MRKTFLFLFSMFILFLSFGKMTTVSAETFQTFEIKIIYDCNLYKNVDLSTTDNLVLEEKLTFGEKLIVIDNEVEKDEFVFYPVRYIKNNTEYEGYVIKNFTMIASNKSLGKKLDSNAKIIKETQVYLEEDMPFLIQGEEIFLKENQEVRVIDNTNKKFKKIMFEINSEIYNGLVKSEDISIKGFNATIITIVFVFILATSIAVSIVLTTRKKRKKERKKLTVK